MRREGGARSLLADPNGPVGDGRGIRSATDGKWLNLAVCIFICSLGSTSINSTQSLVSARRQGRGSWAARLRRCLAIVLTMAAVCAGAWIEREVLLRGAADLWIVSDPITSADAIVVLGGGIDMRPFVAADLYAKGLIKKVLLSKVKEPHQSNSADVLQIPKIREMFS